ncbi:MAG TPA: GAF domain-containing SpoIIE family protein phosphatase [Nocardioidaceae bacterium]|nr:GAF domain-containing SpoIIE family protein phosphatase [Nocardioidaceae bacterium]
MPEPQAGPEPAAEESTEERLRRLLAVTDVALSRLDVDELFAELLERVRELLGTDTAAVLLMDESGRFLVASAARGLEEEVRQGSRVPLGRGFAGRVAAERRPVVLDEVTPASVVNPVLLYKGIKSMLGVPLLDGDVVLGVLHVGTLQARDFTANDVALLEQVADRAAGAIGGAQARSDTAAAVALQRGLAPAQLPDVPGLDLAARYVPDSVTGVGGDWYDVFALPGGLIGATVGDVMGHGLRAATVMGRLRSALRAYALEDDDPASVLDRLDREIQHFEPGQTATAAYAVVDPTSGEVRLASAGHLPAVVSYPGEGAELLERPADVMLGVLPQPRRDTVRLVLPDGGLLCLFTDGLVERRGEDIDQGLRELRDVVHQGMRTAEEGCAHVMAAMVAAHNVDDDVALLVVKRDVAGLARD